MYDRVLLGVGDIGNVAAHLDQLAQDTLVLDDAGIVLYVEGARHHVHQRAQVLRGKVAVLEIPVPDQGVQQRDRIDFHVGDEQLLHGGEYLLVIRQVEVGGCYKVRDMAEGTRIDQHRAEQGLLCDEAEGNLTLQGNLPAVPAPGEGLLSVHDWQPAQLQTSTWILPATSVYSLTSRSYCP